MARGVAVFELNVLLTLTPAGTRTARNMCAFGDEVSMKERMQEAMLA